MDTQANCLGLMSLYMKVYNDMIHKVKDEYGIEVICRGDMDLIGTVEENWIGRCCEKSWG